MGRNGSLVLRCFSFSENYNATHELCQESSDIKGPTVTQTNHIVPQANSVNPFIQPANVNVTQTSKNAPQYINIDVTQTNKNDPQYINMNVDNKNPNVNVPQTNNNTPQINGNAQQTNGNTQQINGNPPQINGNHQSVNENDHNDDLLTKILKTMTQVIQQFKDQHPEDVQQLNQQINNMQNDGQVNPNRPLLNNNQIINGPMQGLRNLMVNQLFKFYGSPNQYQSLNNQQIIQQQNNQQIIQQQNNQQTTQQQNPRQNNNQGVSNRRINNNSDFLNESIVSTIQDEINNNLKQLIDANKLQNFYFLVSNENQNEMMSGLVNSNQDQKKMISEQKEMMLQLIKSNEGQKEMMSQLIKLNESQNEMMSGLVNSNQDQKKMISEQKEMVSELKKSNETQKEFNSMTKNTLERTLALLEANIKKDNKQ